MALGGTDLAALGAQVEWPDPVSAASARDAAHASGRLDELVEWLAGTQGVYPPTPPARPRCLVMGPLPGPAALLAQSLDVGVRAVAVTATTADDALQYGVAVADEEIDSGADLLIVADPDASPSAAVVVSLLSGVEPVALLPRGAGATDTAAWIERAELLRDTRRQVAALRTTPDELLTRLDHPPLAATAGLVLRAVSRRTPVVLDGTVAVVAALLAHHVQPRSVRWLRVADTSPDAVHTRTVDELVQRPLLELGLATGTGIAGLLTVPVLRAATWIGAET